MQRGLKRARRLAVSSVRWRYAAVRITQPSQRVQIPRRGLQERPLGRPAHASRHGARWRVEREVRVFAGTASVHGPLGRGGFSCCLTRRSGKPRHRCRRRACRSSRYAASQASVESRPSCRIGDPASAISQIWVAPPSRRCTKVAWSISNRRPVASIPPKLPRRLARWMQKRPAPGRAGRRGLRRTTALDSCRCGLCNGHDTNQSRRPRPLAPISLCVEGETRRRGLVDDRERPVRQRAGLIRRWNGRAGSSVRSGRPAPGRPPAGR